MTKSSTMFPTFLLIVLLIPLASSTDYSFPKYMSETQTHKVAARDAITLTIHEIRETRKFVDMIPRLKSVQLTLLDPQLISCVESLVYDLSIMKSVLYELRHLKKYPHKLTADANSLQTMMSETVNVGKMCDGSLKNLDAVVPSMLARKLDDLSVFINDVVYHVTEYDRSIYGGP